MSSSPELDLLVVGDANPDVLVLGGDVTPAFGQQEKLVASMSLVTGGSAAITAVAAARLGCRVALAAAVGDDPAGEFMLAQLDRAGVDTSAVAVRPGGATGMTVALSRGTDRAILTAAGVMASLTAADVPAGLLAAARHVHVSAYFLVAESLGPGLAGLLRAARAGGAATSLDTNWDPSGRWRDPHLSAALDLVDLLLPNEAETLALAGRPDLDAAVAALTAAGPALAVKLGARGALCAAGSGGWLATAGHGGQPAAGPEPAAARPGGQPAAGRDPSSGREPAAGRLLVRVPPVVPADTTGAGDCFNAGLIAGLLDGLDLPHAAALGCAAGALSTAAPGGTGSCPDRPAASALAAGATFAPAGPARATFGGPAGATSAPAGPAAAGSAPAARGPAESPPVTFHDLGNFSADRPEKLPRS